VLEAADRAVEARLADIAGSLDDPAETDRAFEGLAVWRRALRAHRAARTARP
jgi:hypothetical protein